MKTVALKLVTTLLLGVLFLISFLYAVDAKGFSLEKQRLRDSARRIAMEEGVDPELFVTLVQHESGFEQSAVSPVGAVGLSQLMPDTARGLGVNPYDAIENLRGGARYFSSLLRKYQGNYRLALAGYNAGPYAVDCFLSGTTGRVGNKIINRSGMRCELPPYKETRNYVATIERQWFSSVGKKAPDTLPQNPPLVARRPASPRTSVHLGMAQTSPVVTVPPVKKKQTTFYYFRSERS
jgi:hypothetical protein